MHKLMTIKQGRMYITLVLVFSNSACQISIDTWVNDENAPKITNEKDIIYWEKKGYREGPCGWILSQKVSKLPPINHPEHVKGTETVVEINDKNRQVASWQTPANSYPVSIQHEKIIINIGISVNKEGTLKKIRPKTTQISFVACPKVFIDNNPDSDYLRCAEYEDSVSGAKRTLMFQTPCT